VPLRVCVGAGDRGKSRNTEAEAEEVGMVVEEEEEVKEVGMVQQVVVEAEPVLDIPKPATMMCQAI
jgi:hypothetical protein